METKDSSEAVAATISVSPVPDEAQLREALEKLKQDATVIADELRGSHRALHHHLASLYMWWRDAHNVPGYLETEYAKLDRRFKKTTKHGQNYSPVLWLAWGKNNDLGDDKVHRWSIVLNKLNAAYESEEQYRTDSVAKLANYIKASGGVDGLIGDSRGKEEDEKNDDDVGDEEADRILANAEPQPTMEEKLAKLYGIAKNFYEAVSHPPTITLSHPVPVTEDGMALILVRKAGSAYQLVGSSSDDAIAREVTMDTYLRDYSALPTSIRAVVETISTQCLPRSLQPYYEQLIDPAAGNTSGTKSKAIRRLMFRHDTGDLVLSPMRAMSGVVTLVKPVQPVLDNANKDVFLATKRRRAVEQRLICGKDFNLYGVARGNQDVIPEYWDADLASHAIRIDSRFSDDYVQLDFWPFHTGITSLEQLIPASSSIASGSWSWRVTLDSAWIRKFALEFTTPWVRGLGGHIRRVNQRVVQLDFNSKSLIVHFDRRDDIFEVKRTVDFGGATPTGPGTSVCTLTKDFIVAMQAIADLSLQPDVELRVQADVLSVGFKTTVAEYCVNIPTCSIDGVRNTRAFVQYTPSPIAVRGVNSWVYGQEQ